MFYQDCWETCFNADNAINGGGSGGTGIFFTYILQAAFLLKCLEKHFSTHRIGEKAAQKMLFKLTPGGAGGTGGSGAGGSLQAEYNALYSLVEAARTTRLMSG